MRNLGRDCGAPSYRIAGDQIHTGRSDVKPNSARQLIADAKAALLSTERPPRLRPVRALFREE
jgi:hypothetical protein